MCDDAYAPIPARVASPRAHRHPSHPFYPSDSHLFYAGEEGCPYGRRGHHLHGNFCDDGECATSAPLWWLEDSLDNHRCRWHDRHAESHKTFLYPLTSCALSWAPHGTQGSVLRCNSEAGVVSSECRWMGRREEASADAPAYRCHQTVTSPEHVQSVEHHNACTLSVDPALNLAQFRCDDRRG